jgi:hypothetical protein
MEPPAEPGEVIRTLSDTKRSAARRGDVAIHASRQRRVVRPCFAEARAGEPQDPRARTGTSRRTARPRGHDLDQTPLGPHLRGRRHRGRLEAVPVPVRLPPAGEAENHTAGMPPDRLLDPLQDGHGHVHGERLIEIEEPGILREVELCGVGVHDGTSAERVAHRRRRIPGVGPNPRLVGVRKLPQFYRIRGVDVVDRVERRLLLDTTEPVIEFLTVFHRAQQPRPMISARYRVASRPLSCHGSTDRRTRTLTSVRCVVPDREATGACHTAVLLDADYAAARCGSVACPIAVPGRRPAPLG